MENAMHKLGLALLASLSWVGTIGAAPAPIHRVPVDPVVVELFTSQGCSSCPPADAVLGRLAADPRVIAISRPVTYWDQLGWRDTLAREANTRLQRRYAARDRSGQVYTPQAVVQGGRGLVGSREADLRRIVAATHPAARIVATRANGATTLTVSGRAAHPARVTIVALRRSVPVRIGRGENGGRAIVYTNVVRDEHVVATWRGGTQRIAIPAATLRVAGADRYAVLVQEADGGPILAARYL